MMTPGDPREDREKSDRNLLRRVRLATDGQQVDPPKPDNTPWTKEQEKSWERWFWED